MLAQAENPGFDETILKILHKHHIKSMSINWFGSDETREVAFPPCVNVHFRLNFAYQVVR